MWPFSKKKKRDTRAGDESARRGRSTTDYGADFESGDYASYHGRDDDRDYDGGCYRGGYRDRDTDYDDCHYDDEYGDPYDSEYDDRPDSSVEWADYGGADPWLDQWGPRPVARITEPNGPYNGEEHHTDEFDFSDFCEQMLDLGSFQVPLPHGSQIQVEMGERGPRMVHILTDYGRVTPVVFASPASGNQWNNGYGEIANKMREDGLKVRIEDGEWGKQIVGVHETTVFRIIAVEGNRWLLRFTLIAPERTAIQLADLARGMILRTFVHRGDMPMMAGTPLAVTLPESISLRVREAVRQRHEAEKAAAVAPQQAPTSATTPPVPHTAQQQPAPQQVSASGGSPSDVDEEAIEETGLQQLTRLRLEFSEQQGSSEAPENS